MKPEILLVSTPDVDHFVLEFLTRELERIFGLKVREEGGFELMARDFNQMRQQFNATKVLLHLPKPPGNFYLLGITGDDLFAYNLNFVFGVASILSRQAIISLYRLRVPVQGKTVQEDQFLRRILTEAVHELGHLMGLSHCPNAFCVMHFSNTLADTDIKGPNFCESCRILLRHE